MRRHRPSGAVLSLGSNLGDSRALLADAVRSLGDLVRATSSVYRTPPWGGVEQNDFLNLVVITDPIDDTKPRADADTPILQGVELDDEDPHYWLTICRLLEQRAGRVRDIRWGPRTLDADVVVIGRRMSADPELTVPHPRAHERAFVLVPWAEVDPGAELPGHGPIADLIDAMDTSQIHRIGPL